MSLSAGKDRLVAATKELRVKWDQTREHWTDTKAQAFEKQYILELLAAVDSTVTVINELEELVGQIRSDCE